MDRDRSERMLVLEPPGFDPYPVLIERGKIEIVDAIIVRLHIAGHHLANLVHPSARIGKDRAYPEPTVFDSMLGHQEPEQGRKLFSTKAASLYAGLCDRDQGLEDVRVDAAPTFALA